MRYVLIALIALHALIHLIGVAKEWRLAQVPGFSGATAFSLPVSSGTIGAFWLVACLAFLSAAVMLLQAEPRWWMMAAGALLLSQALIIYAWPDAKAGTIANALIALAVVSAWSSSRFDAQSDAQARSMLASAARAPAQPVQPSELEALPPPVRDWLRDAGVVGRPRVRSVRLQQSGGMRLAADQAFMPARAQQYFSVDPPGFVWRVSVPMFHVPIVGRDSYAQGHGRMQIKALGLVPIVDARGAEIDQGTLLRFLGELAWFPSAALAPYLRWESIDESSARATMSYEGVSASADFAFDAQHRLSRVSARRYMKSGSAPATLEPWVVRMTRWEKPDGVLIPTEGEVSWELASGELTYYRFRIEALQENPSATYEDAP